MRGLVKLKAMLLCEDLRFELGGTFTLIGVLGERIAVSAGPDPIVMPKLALVTVVGGLRGAELVRFRQWIRAGDDAPANELTSEAHDPATDEHNFVFLLSPAVFPGEGTYEIGIDLEVGERQATFRYAFAITRG